MSDVGKIIAAIAASQLGIETLEERKSDALDFHTVSVWTVKAALRAAYEAGAASSAQARAESKAAAYRARTRKARP